jgi:hypothetical protein
MIPKKFTGIIIIFSGIILTVAIFFGEGLMAHLHAATSPGPLSAVRAAELDGTKSTRVGGFSSHAEFESECGHCHVPLHCVEDTSCQECHMEIAEQRLSINGLHGLFPDVAECEECHKEHMGREASITEFAFHNIDHQLLSGFSLEKHSHDYQGEVLNCESCHSQDKFKKASLDCITCHSTEAHDQIAGHIEAYGSDCVPCHDGSDRMEDFDHNHFYPLDGEHIDLDCEECHLNKVFAGTPQDCTGCHIEPEIHFGIFGIQCERCHGTAAWMPAQIKDHNFTEGLCDGLEGEELTCETCHEYTYTEYPCYSCHEFQEMVDYHKEIDILADYNCIECHPTGRTDAADKFMKTDP